MTPPADEQPFIINDVREALRIFTEALAHVDEHVGGSRAEINLSIDVSRGNFRYRLDPAELAAIVHALRLQSWGFDRVATDAGFEPIPASATK